MNNADPNERKGDGVSAIHDAIQANPTNFKEDCVLVRWALVCDWVAPDGTRFLSREMAEGCTNWERDGLYHESLYGDWALLANEEEDDDDE